MKHLVLLILVITISIAAVAYWMHYDDGQHDSPLASKEIDQRIDSERKLESNVSGVGQEPASLATDFINADGELSAAIQKMMVTDVAESLATDYRELLDGDAGKVDLLVSLARDKMERDLEIRERQVNDPLSAAELELLTAANAELDAEEFDRLQQLAMASETLDDELEESRIQYEDQVTALLSAREVERLQDYETRRATQHLSKLAQLYAISLKVKAGDLNKYQLSEIDRISNDFSNGAAEPVPLGSSLRVADTSSDTLRDERYQALLAELQSVLTPTQLDRIRQSPVLTLP